MPDFSIEKQFTDHVIGLDEVGRGPLAGPVISCGCYFKNYIIQEDFNKLIGDSKKLSEKKRNVSFKFLQNCLLYTSPSPRDQRGSRMPSSA